MSSLKDGLISRQVYQARPSTLTSHHHISRMAIASACEHGLRPVARQIAARGRLCAGDGWPGVLSPAAPARCTAFLLPCACLSPVPVVVMLRVVVVVMALPTLARRVVTMMR